MSYLLSLPTYAIVLIGIAGLVLIAAAVYLFVLRRRTKPPAKPAVEGKESLTSLWEQFLEKLPREVQFLPVAVVFGGARAGKTTVIQAHVDWEAEFKQLYPSAPGDSRLQLYAGHNVLVQEIAWELLKETDAAVERRLTDLWEPFADSAPTVVVTLDASSLSSPEDLRSLADFLRGKLNIIAKIRGGAPTRFRLCLTHLDEVEGYREILAAMGDAREGLVLTIDTSQPGGAPDEATILRSFQPLEGFVARVLVTRPAPEFRRALGFFNDALPRISRALAPFLKELLGSGHLASAPVLDGLYLSGLAPAEQAASPFSVESGSTEAAVSRFRKKHLLLAAAIAVGLGLATAGLLAYHSSQLQDATTAVTVFKQAAEDADIRGKDDFDAQKKADNAAKAAADEARAVASQDRFPLFRGVAEEDKVRIREDFLGTVRSHYLFPRIKEGKDRVTILYAVALVYAASDNDLGRELALKDVPGWAHRLDLPEGVVRDYVELSPWSWIGKVTIPATLPSAPDARVTSLDEWRRYLEDLEGVFASESITTSALARLQEQTTLFLGALDAAKVYPDAQRVARMLVREAPVDPAEIDRLLTPVEVPAWVTENQAQLSPLLKLVKETSLSYSAPGKMSLGALMTQLGATPAITIPEATYSLTLQNRSFKFLTRTWADLLNRSRSGLLVDAFLNGQRNSTDWAFFVDSSIYADVGRAAVAGKGASEALPGEFTRAAFDAEVSPALQTFSAQLDKAPLSSADRSRLSSYVASEVERYASAYRDALSRYYGSFVLQASSAGVLQAMLAELSSPSSWLTDFLRTVSENAALTLGEGSYFKTISRKLEGFAPIVALMTEAKGQYPNVEKYVGLLAPLAQPATGGGTGDPTLALADRVSPMGKAALAILKSDKDSVLAQVQPWLGAAGILGSHAVPFLRPVELGYGYGIGEVNRVMEAGYRDEVLPDIKPVLSRFPFDTTVRDEAQAADIEALFLPVKGRYWASFQRLLAPVCVLKDGRYAAISGPYGQARLPRGSLDTANAVLVMDAALWDDAGKKKTIPLSFQPLPLPVAEGEDAVPTLSVLKTGKASFYGFNQRPAWEAHELSWWDQGASAIELQLGTPGKQDKQYRSIEVADSSWSLHRLLTKATVTKADSGVLTWLVTVTNAGATKSVRLALRGDPWAAFRVPLAP